MSTNVSTDWNAVERDLAQNVPIGHALVQNTHVTLSHTGVDTLYDSYLEMWKKLEKGQRKGGKERKGLRKGCVRNEHEMKEKECVRNEQEK